ncbi:MAG: hypothetical protein ACI4LO_07765 [Anaerovoracaceae bacterium]
MNTNDWKYYNHAMIPSVAPHEMPDMSIIEDGSIWRSREKDSPLLARWTTDFDCEYKTNWWYVIKDKPFDLSLLKSNYRYKINKGIKNFDVREINPKEYIDELYEVFIAAFDSWPSKYRPNFTYEEAIRSFQKTSEDSSIICYGAFYRETGELCGFMQANTYGSFASLQVQRVKPMYEKYQINAALVHFFLDSNQSKLMNGNFYILDGARSINHETNFQDYLEKYFGFRKAYCKLHIVYNPKIKWLIKLIYPIRKALLKFDNIGIIHKVNSILKMEECCQRITPYE